MPGAIDVVSLVMVQYHGGRYAQNTCYARASSSSHIWVSDDRMLHKIVEGRGGSHRYTQGKRKSSCRDVNRMSTKIPCCVVIQLTAIVRTDPAGLPRKVTLTDQATKNYLLCLTFSLCYTVDGPSNVLSETNTNRYTSQPRSLRYTRCGLC